MSTEKTEGAACRPARKSAAQKESNSMAPTSAAVQLANNLRGIDARSSWANDKLTKAADELERLHALAASAPVAPSPQPVQAGVTTEQRRIIGVIADKIEDGTLFQSGIYSKKDLARFVRNMLDAAPQAEPVAPALQPAMSNVVNAYCKAWEASFLADNPFHKVFMQKEDKKHILAGLSAALAAPLQQGEYLPLPEPDTHCHDEDTGKDVWSHSAGQMRAYVDADRAQAAQPEGGEPA